MQFADSNWPNKPERVVVSRAMQPYLCVFVSDKRNDYTNKRLHHRVGLFAPRAQQLFWESASRLTLRFSICVHVCAMSHGLTKTYLWLTFHTPRKLHDWGSWCIACSVSRCWGFVRMWPYKRQESLDEEAPRQAEGKLTGSAASPAKEATEALSWRASAHRVQSSAGGSSYQWTLLMEGVGGGFRPF